MIKGHPCLSVGSKDTDMFRLDAYPTRQDHHGEKELPVVVTGVFAPKQGRPAGRPLALDSIAAGFPSPAEDYTDRELDLNEHLVRHPSATFFVRAAGDSMQQAGIHSGDILVVDRALEAGDGSVVVAVIHGELTVKRLRIRHDRLWLVPENPDFPPMEISEDMDFEVWGVVTHAIHSLTAR